MTRWAITGATGFIGAHLCRRLHAEGEGVVALVRPGHGGGNLVARATVQAVDLRDETGVELALTGADVCVHLAAPRRGRSRGWSRVPRNLRGGDTASMVEATGALIRAGARAGLRRLVIASSAAVYGHRWDLVEDGDQPTPDSPYSRDRLAGDLLGLSLGTRLGVEVVVARLSEVFGPGSLVHYSLFRCIAQGDFRVPGDGRIPHQLLYVDDAVRALIACGARPGVAGETMLVAGPRPLLRDWVDGIAEALGTTARYYRGAAGPGRAVLRALSGLPAWVGGARRLAWDYLLRPRAYSVGRSQRLLGSYQLADLGQGIGETVGWVGQHDLR